MISIYRKIMKRWDFDIYEKNSIKFEQENPKKLIGQPNKWLYFHNIIYGS